MSEQIVTTVQLQQNVKASKILVLRRAQVILEREAGFRTKLKLTKIQTLVTVTCVWGFFPSVSRLTVIDVVRVIASIIGIKWRKVVPSHRNEPNVDMSQVGNNVYLSLDVTTPS